jgi:hypothetical protein
MEMKRALRGGAIAAVAIGLITSSLLVASPTLAATSVNETFEDGVADGFTVVTGAYSIVTDGTKVYKTTSATARAVVGDAASTNVDVSADIKVASWSATTGRTAGLMARYVDTNNYYLFVYEDGYLQIKKKVGGTLTTVNQVAYTWNTGTTYTLRGTVSGSTLNLYVNGVLQVTGTTTGISAGRVGLISFNGDVRNDNVVASDISAPPSTTDPYGITELNPTATGAREWFSTWGTGSSRSTDWGFIDPGLVIRGDMVATIAGASGTRSGQMTVTGPNPRIYIRDSESDAIPPSPTPSTWNNVEVTFFAYSSMTNPSAATSYAGIEAVAKTNHFPDTWNCTTRGYGGRMLFDGRIDFEKEVSHTAPEVNVQQSQGTWTYPLNQWIGYKFVARNVDNNTHVKLEMYRDTTLGNQVNPSVPAGGGNWVKVGEYTDTGTWSAGYGNCTAQNAFDTGKTDRSLPLTWPNYSVYLRTDDENGAGLTQYYKWLSVREVAPLP